jgi:putative flippase GtrA
MTSLLEQSLRFVAVGFANTAIGLTAIYALMFFFAAGPGLANAAGYAIGLAVSFLLNRVWTFRNNRPISHVLPRFLLVAVVSYLLNLGVVLTATSHFGANPYIAQLFGVGLYTICMFFGCRLFVFTLECPADTVS